MKKLMLIGIALMVTLGGCNLANRDFYLEEENFPDQYNGMVVLILDGSSLPNKTLVPGDITMQANFYDLSFVDVTGGGAGNFPESDWPASVAYTRNGLTPGVWRVSITAKDDATADPLDVVGCINGNPADYVEFTITAGVVTLVENVKILPIIGSGDMDLALTWPFNLLSGAPASNAVNGTIDMYFVPVGQIDAYNAATPTERTTNWGIPDTSFTKTDGDPNDQAAYTSTGETTGYYALFIKLMEGPTQLLAMVETVRIVDGHETNGTVDLTVNTGGVNVSTDVDLQNPVLIVFSPTTTPSLGSADSVLVTATLTYPTPPADSYTYEWYVDGLRDAAPAALSGLTVTFNLLGSAYTTGNHHLTLLITGTTGSDLTLSTGDFPFAVQ